MARIDSSKMQDLRPSLPPWIWKNPLKRGMTEFHDMQSGREYAAALLFGTVLTGFYVIGEAS